MGYKTIEEGKHAILYDAQGRGTLIVGPRRVSKVVTLTINVLYSEYSQEILLPMRV